MPHIPLSLFLWLAVSGQTPGAGTVPPREAFVDLPGVRLAYVDSGGSGVPLVLLHAATGSSRTWEYQIPVFTAAGYRVIAFDRRGYGRTQVASGAPSASAADDLHALMEHLKIDRFHLLGTAAGGFVAVDYALAFGRRLRTLTIANSIGGVQDEDYLALGRRIRPPAFNALPPDVRELGPSYRAASPDGTRRWLELEHSHLAATPSPEQPMRNRVTFQALETIDTPTLMLTGGADLYAPPPVMQLFVKRIKGAESVVIPEAGHSAYWEQPDAFNAAVLEFLRKH